MAAAYDYLFLALARVPTPHQALAERLRGAAGAEIVGQFAPQLGWAANDAAVLVRWREGAAGDLSELTTGPLVASARHDRLTPTLRPADDAWPPAGGIYVHRWFEVGAGDVEEFLALSGRAWGGFESEFDTSVFGLFRAEPSEADRAADAARLLLITGYKDHGVWEASRTPTTEAAQAFARRQQITRRTWAASSRLVA